MASKTPEKNNTKKSLNPDLHAKHRSRVRAQFRATGLNGFHDHNVLEMLLFYCIPRQNTNELAHELINEFGSFDAVLDAPIEALAKVKGIGLESATFIHFMPEVFRYYMSSKVKDKTNIKTSDDAAEVLRPYFIGATTEKFVVMYLTGKGKLLKCTETTQNELASVHSDFKSIISEATILGAGGIVIAHNHPIGFASPSLHDISLTDKLYSICQTFNIHLCDHIIFSTKDTYFASKNEDAFEKAKFVFD